MTLRMQEIMKGNWEGAGEGERAEKERYREREGQGGRKNLQS